MSQEIFRGHIYVIPTPLQVYENQGEYHYDVQDIKGPQVCFRGCIISDDYKNWSSYYHKKIGKISDWFPVELFMGKKEGDLVELTIHNKYVILTCLQKPYASGSITFENTLYNTSQSFAGIYYPKDFQKPITKEYQELMLITNHIKYSRSHNFEITHTFRFKCV